MAGFYRVQAPMYECIIAEFLDTQLVSSCKNFAFGYVPQLYLRPNVLPNLTCLCHCKQALCKTLPNGDSFYAPGHACSSLHSRCLFLACCLPHWLAPRIPNRAPSLGPVKGVCQPFFFSLSQREQKCSFKMLNTLHHHVQHPSPWMLMAMQSFWSWVRGAGC